MPARQFYRVIGIIATLCLSIQPALAGPGGKIVSAAFETFWGRIILTALTIFFLPLIISITLNEKLATRRAHKDLAFMAQYDRNFDWLDLRMRAKECFQRVHLGWQDGDLSDVNEWMTSWYWQNQQSVHLNQWKNEGLSNVCNVRKIKEIRPLLFVHRNDNDTEHEGSQIILGITAKMQDYLINTSTGKTVEGSKKWKDVETLWTLTLTNGEWLVSDIEEDSYSYAYSKLRKNLPNIENTLTTRFNA